jgi:type I restriction enzyme, S subunit
MQVKEIKSEYQLVQLCKLSQSQKTQIPTDWEVKSLKDIADLNPDSIDQNYNQKQILYIDISSVENYEIHKYERYYLDKRPIRAQRIVRKHDIIVSTVRPYLKAFAKIRGSQPNLVCSTGFVVIRPKNPLDVDFVFNYVKGHLFKINIIRHMEGLAYPAVTANIVGNSLIPYSKNTKERIKIGSIFSNLDELIRKTDQVIKQTQRLKKGLMQRLLSKGIGHDKFKEVNFGGQIIEIIPTSWEKISLNALSKNGTQNGIAISIEDYGKGVPIVGMTDLFANDILDYSRLRQVSITNGTDQFSLKNGDLIFARRSLNVEGAGKCVLIPKIPYPIVFESSVIRMTMNTEKVIPEFVHYMFSSNIGRRIMSRIVRVVAVSGITGSDLGNVNIPLPESLKEQQTITFILSNIDSYIKTQFLYKFQLSILKKGLTQKLLTGKIRVKI